MKYAFIIERENGEREHGIFAAANTAAAHGYMLEISGGEKYHVYPMNRALLALSIATATAKNAVMRQGTPTQVTIDMECRMLSGMTAAAMLARPDMTGHELTVYIMERLPLFGADMQDFFGFAMLGIEKAAAAGYPVNVAALAGYKTLNHYLHTIRAANAREVSTEYIIDGGGDLVAYTAAIASIIRGGERWTATDGEGMTAAQAAKLGAAIAGAAAMLSPVQRHIMEMLGRGYSLRQIAEKTGRALSTVAQNTAILRGKIAQYMEENAPEYTTMTSAAAIDSAAAIATAAAVNERRNKRTAAGAARKAESDKATQAARAAAYRARKKAAALAAKQANQ